MLEHSLKGDLPPLARQLEACFKLDGTRMKALVSQLRRSFRTLSGGPTSSRLRPPSNLEYGAELEPKYYVALLGVFLLALGVRVGLTEWFVGLNSPPKFSANPDQVDYEAFAYKMSLGQGYTAFTGEPTARRAPGTSFTLYPIYAIFGRSFLMGRLWFCFLSALTCVAVAWAVRPYLDRCIAVAAGLGLALYPGHFYYAMHFLSEVPFCLYLTLACGFVLRSIRERSTAYDLLAGLFWALAALTRLKIILVLPLGFVLVLLFSRSRWPRMVSIGWQLAMFMLVISPWLARNAVVMHKPAICTVVGGYTFWGAHNDQVLQHPELAGEWINTTDLTDANHPLPENELDQEAAAWRYGMEWVEMHLSEMPGLCVSKLCKLVSPFVRTPNMLAFWGFACGWLVLVPLIAPGLVFLARRDPEVFSVLLIPLLATIVTALIFYGSARFRDSIAPVFVILAATTLVEIRRRFILGLPSLHYNWAHDR